MFMTLRNKFKDVGTLSTLCEDAERVARSDGNERPGSEHFVLASLHMSDGTALRALAGLGATPETFAAAVRVQFMEALGSAGLEMSLPEEPGLPSLHLASSPSRLYNAAPSGQSLVQRLASTAEVRKERPLLAADILVAAAQEEFSITARAFRVLGIARQDLVQAASREITRYEHREVKV